MQPIGAATPVPALGTSTTSSSPPGSVASPATCQAGLPTLAAACSSGSASTAAALRLRAAPSTAPPPALVKPRSAAVKPATPLITWLVGSKMAFDGIVPTKYREVALSPAVGVTTETIARNSAPRLRVLIADRDAGFL